MTAFTRLLVIVLVLLTLCYGLVSLYLHLKWRRALKQEWQQRQLQGSEARYLSLALYRYRRRWRPVLIAVTYVLPVTAMLALVYFINFT